MKQFFLFGVLASIFAGCAGAKLQRVPPGQSIARHLQGPPAQATEALPSPTGIELPMTAAPTDAAMGLGQANPQFAGRTQIISATSQKTFPPLLVSGLPERNDGIERASDAYSRGSMLMKNGQNREAIASFEEATQLAPSFADAWTRLTLLYEKTGQPDKAREALRRAKRLSAQPERITTPASTPTEPTTPVPTPVEPSSPTPAPAVEENVPLPPPK